MCVAGEPDDVTKTSKVKEKKEGPEKLPGCQALLNDCQWRPSYGS